MSKRKQQSRFNPRPLSSEQLAFLAQYPTLGKFYEVPASHMEIDNENVNRVHTPEAIQKRVAEWDDGLCDPLKVSVRWGAEDHEFHLYPFDGGGRLEAKPIKYCDPHVPMLIVAYAFATLKDEIDAFLYYNSKSAHVDVSPTDKFRMRLNKRDDLIVNDIVEISADVGFYLNIFGEPNGRIKPPALTHVATVERAYTEVGPICFRLGLTIMYRMCKWRDNLLCGHQAVLMGFMQFVKRNRQHPNWNAAKVIQRLGRVEIDEVLNRSGNWAGRTRIHQWGAIADALEGIFNDHLQPHNRLGYDDDAEKAA